MTSEELLAQLELAREAAQTVVGTIEAIQQNVRIARDDAGKRAAWNLDGPEAAIY